MPRSVEEWVGRTDDVPFPPRVRLRIFAKANGHCQECGRKIRSGDRWIADHTVALVNGGENRESNGRCICDWCDKHVKTPADVAEKSKTARVLAKHLGIRPPSKFQSAGFRPAVPQRSASRPIVRKSERQAT